MSKRKLITDLFFTMFKIGAFTFGGGYAMISVLQNEFVEKKKWISEEEFLDLVAIAESTPGPIAINSSTYIGYRVGGFLGAFFSTAAMCLPSLIIIYTISLFFDQFLSLTLVANAFRGIQACVIYLIFSAGLKMFKGLKKSTFSRTLFSLTILCMLVFSLLAVKFSSIFYILISGALGILVWVIGKMKKGEEK